MISPWPFLVIFTLTGSVFVRHFLEANWYWLTPIEVFIMIPLLDLVVRNYRRNPTPEQERALSGRRAFGYITWACAVTQVASVVAGAWAFSRPEIGLLRQAGVILAVGIASGVMGINVSHELIHRIDNRLEPLLGRMMLLTVLYLHWAIEHVSGHHRRVATPEDPATARLGESYYAFWPRTVFGGFESAWGIERERLARKGLAAYGRHNRILLYLALQAAFVAAIALIFGGWAIVFVVGQALVAVSLLESVNYLEHYGLMREKLDDGGYEKVTTKHSWNQSARLTNWYLFNLMRHSDHHARPAVRYQSLHHRPESPQLPFSYAGLVPLTLAPLLWFRVMDKRVKEAGGGEADNGGSQQVDSRQ